MITEPSVLIVLVIVIVIGSIIAISKKNDSHYNSKHQRNHDLSVTSPNRVKPSVHNRFLKASKQQSKSIDTFIKVFITTDYTHKHKVISKLQTFQIQYWKNITFDSDLYDYILKVANERISTAKKDFVKRECKQVIQVIMMLKDGALEDEIVQTILAPKEYMETNESNISSGEEKRNEQPNNHNDAKPNNDLRITGQPENHHPTLDKESLKQLCNNVKHNNVENVGVTTPAISQIINGLTNRLPQLINGIAIYAINRENNNINNDKSSRACYNIVTQIHNSTDISVPNKSNTNIIDVVPYWAHTYVCSINDLKYANHQQRKFYNYFKAQFLQERYLDIEGNSNYVFVLMYDLADEYKKHQNLILLKRQLNVLAENYPIVSKYIDRAILDVVADVNQENAEKKLKNYEKSCGQLCRWIEPNEVIEVQGIKLTRGNYYIGECFTLPERIIRDYDIYIFGYKGSHIFGPVLNPDLSANNSDNFKNIFCSYNDMSPAWRHDYLMWLSDRTYSSEVSIEILLFYLYGCEIRMFIDPQTSKSERVSILHEVINIYKSIDIIQVQQDKSFLKKKLTDFIGGAIIAYFRDIQEEFDIKRILRDCKIYQDYYIAHKIKGEKILSPKNALDIAKEIYDFEQIVPSRYHSVAQKYFLDTFIGLYPNFKVDTQKETHTRSVCYYLNHTYFSSEKVSLNYRIDFTVACNNYSIINSLKYCYWSVENKFRHYNQAIARSNGKETIAAIQLLPNDIDILEIPKIQALIDNINDKMQPEGYLVTPIDWLFDLWEYERKDEKNIHKGQVDSFIDGLCRLGYGIAPNNDIDRKRFNFGDICVIYKNDAHYPVKSTTKYERSEIFIKLASYIVHADQPTDNDFIFAEQQLKSYDNTPGNHLHLTAVIRWRFLSKKLPLDKSTKNAIANLTSEHQITIGSALIKLACMNGDIHPKRIECLKKVLPLLGVDVGNIHSQIHRLLTDSEGFAVIEKKSDSVEFPINSHQLYPQSTIEPTNIINPQKLRIFEQQTKEAQELLSSIFVEEESATSQKAKSGSSTTVWIEVLKLLFTKDTWERAEAEKICKERGLMLGAILEQINDFAYEKVDDAVIEDDGNYIYVTLDYKEQLI